MVTPEVVMSVNLFLFLTSQYPTYFQSTPSKQRQILKTGFTLPLTFSFFHCLFPHRFPIPASTACFHNSLAPQFLAYQSFLAPNHNHVEQSLFLPELQQFVNAIGMKSGTKIIFLVVCSSLFSDIKSLKNVSWELMVSLFVLNLSCSKPVSCVSPSYILELHRGLVFWYVKYLTWLF